MKKEIKLDEDYRIYRDQYCWALIYEHKGEINPETGKPRTTIRRTYHGTVKQAGLKYLDEVLTGHESLEKMLKQLEATEKALLTLINLLNIK